MRKLLPLLLLASLATTACMAQSPADAPSPTVAPASRQAPEFAGIQHWINTPPLTMQSLRGKVVLVEFWTYDCVNCLRAMPYVKQWHQRYARDGLVVVGVHTPEYGHERVLGNLERAVRRLGVTYPVAQDNGYRTWRAYDNQYWPALYLVDQRGRVVYSHFGEEQYAQTEARIRGLLGK